MVVKVGFCTLGCKVNTYESEYLIQELKKCGYEIAPFTDICDIYIIHTCTVTNTSDIKSRKMIRAARRRNPASCVVAMGCFIEANGQYKSDDIDIYIGNKNKQSLLSLLDEFFVKKEVLREESGQEKDQFEDMFLTSFEGRSRAFVKIQDGCENFCSYCIIPYVRGKCRSKDKDKVLAEVKTLVARGYKEIVLTGIHTGNYGVDKDTDFASLLQALVTIKGLKRLRISSIEMTELTTKVIDIIAKNQVIVDHLHIPLQAGSNHVLQLMNRKYNKEQYLTKIKEIKAIRPRIAITTDIIVGFPGESEADFQETCAFAKEVPFAKIHVFPYSERKGTKAATLEGALSKEEKKARARKLLQLSGQLEKAYQEQFVGKVVAVLFEETKEGISIGHTSNYLKIKVAGEIPCNTIKNVLITASHWGCCLGQVEEEGVLCHI